MGWEDQVEFSTLVGKTLVSVSPVWQKGDEEILFETDNGEIYKMYHYQDCCENVYVEDICGDIQDIIGSPIVVAEEVVSSENPVGCDMSLCQDESFTWTFYKIDTAKGGVTIRWCGSSNGYYSETVDFEKIK